jgi:hypothetical protein
MAASSSASAFAERYFGLEWDSYLLKRGWVTSPTDTTFHDTIASAFDLLNTNNQQRLISFITQVEFNDGNNYLVRILLNIVLKKSYTRFYDKIYASLEDGKYTYNDLCLVFLELIEVDKTSNLKEENESNESIIRENGLTEVIKVDNSVIDVTGQSQKIEYHSEASSVKPYPYNASIDVNTLPYLYEEVRLGTKYKDKLGLSKKEVEWLNKFWNPNNVFLAIEGCCIATIRLYIVVMREISKYLESTGTSLTKEVVSFFILISNEYGYRRNYDWSNNYNNYYKDKAELDIFWTVFKKCENAVRTVFGHKRKLEELFNYSSSIEEKFNERIGIPVDRIIESNRQVILQPDDDTIIELNQQNVSRWKPEFEALEVILVSKGVTEFINGVYRLAHLNRKNPSVENIYFEASKVIAKINRTESVKFYLNYLYADLKSAKIDRKQLTKTIQKALFKTNEDLQEFEKLVGELLKERDIESVIEKASTIFSKKRKKIQLNSIVIKEVKEQHSETVELLNEFLEDEYEDDNNTIKMIELGNGEIQLSILSKTAEKRSEFLRDLNISNYQESLLKLFEISELKLSSVKLDLFAKENGQFRNQLIDSVNERCFDLLDDVLIEIEDSVYVINKDYFDKIKGI